MLRYGKMRPMSAFDLDSLADTESLAGRIARLLRPGDSLLLEGELGAGKTALARALLRTALGDPALEVPSPSYTLVQHYDGPAFGLSHFDLWRLDGPHALPELGWDEACRGVVLVEWPDRLGPLAPADALTLRLRAVAGDQQRRRVELSGWPDRIAALRG